MGKGAAWRRGRIWGLRRSSALLPSPVRPPLGPREGLAQGSSQRDGQRPCICRHFTLTHSFGVRHGLWTFNHAAGA